jgi:hypothetical protein
VSGTARSEGKSWANLGTWDAPQRNLAVPNNINSSRNIQFGPDDRTMFHLLIAFHNGLPSLLLLKKNESFVFYPVFLSPFIFSVLFFPLFIFFLPFVTHPLFSLPP